MPSLITASRAALFLALLLSALPATAPANLVQNGTFTSITYSGTPALTTLYGQFGSETGSTLTVTGWTTSGYNFVYAPGTADAGTNAGANAGQPKEAPGQYNNGAGYGTTYMWGPQNGSANGLPATDPGNGNFIAMDGAYETGAVTQTITGLTAGKVYVLLFYWAGVQQQSFSAATTESLTVGFGTNSQSTSTVDLSGSGFSGWMHEDMQFTAYSGTETLSFLAVGTPSGEPPFTLVGDVNLTLIPDFSNWMVFSGFGAACIGVEVLRRRRRKPELTPAA